MRVNDRNRAWVVVGLLFILMVINFADKAVIGIAAVPIMQELQLGPRQFGLVGSSFSLLFAISSVATGFLVNRVQMRWVLLAMGFVWALIQFPMIGSVAFEILVTCRIALGAGESPAAPVALHSVYKWFPNELRTLPTVVIVQGGAIGVMLALPLFNWVIVRFEPPPVGGKAHGRPKSARALSRPILRRSVSLISQVSNQAAASA